MPDTNLLPFVRYLEGLTPEAFIFNLMGQDPSRSMQQFAGSQVDPIFNRFKGEIAKHTLVNPDLPEIMFSDWLGQNFDMNRQFRRHGGGASQGMGGPFRYMF